MTTEEQIIEAAENGLSSTSLWVLTWFFALLSKGHHSNTADLSGQSNFLKLLSLSLDFNEKG